ncbi:MAG: biotin/lipoyl-containing protein [Planctomycetota bacterium]
MRYFVKIGEEELEVGVQPSEGGLLLSVGEQSYPVDAVAVEEGQKYSVLIGRRSFAVSVDGDGRHLALIVNGHAHQMVVEDERERTMREIAGQDGGQGGEVASVMPGIVRKIHVQVGSEVKVGDRLLILEAMKMENEICAEMDAVVTAVHVTDGQTVDGGDPLVSLAPAAGEK